MAGGDTRLTVWIVDDRREPACGTGCGGTDWSQPDNILMARDQLLARFKTPVDIRYFEFNNAPPAVKAQLKDQVLPALIIDKHVRVSGQFDMRVLLEAVDTQLEITGGRSQA